MDESGDLLNTGRHEVYCALYKPERMVQLARALFRVLSTGQHVNCRPILHIVAEQNLFPCQLLVTV